VDVQCDPGEQCVPDNTCPQWQEEIKVWNIIKNRLNENSPAYTSKLKRLQARICNKSARGVCCAEPVAKVTLPTTTTTTTTTSTTTDTTPTNTTRLTNTSDCDLSLPSCLPTEKCGLTEDTLGRVVGGKNTSPGEFPFTALLGYHAQKRIFPPNAPVRVFNVTQWRCGGTLINRWYVVTAGHCQGKGNKAITTVRLGEYQVTQSNAPDCLSDGVTCLPPVQDFDISPEAVTIHPEYDRRPSNVYNDIALVRLPRPAVLNIAVQVVCLPVDSAITARELGVVDLLEGLEGTFPHVVGWGHTDPFGRQFDEAHVPSALQQRLEVPLISTEDCNLLTPIHSQICAGGEPGKDSCSGDSGGPLYLKTVDPSTRRVDSLETSRWHLLGIVSFGTKVCGVGRPGIYTRVETFMPWIKKTLAIDGNGT